MRHSRTCRGYLAIAAVLCALGTGGCAYRGMPRIDPTGERFFVAPPAADTPPFQDQPAWPPSGENEAVTLSPHLTVAPVGSEVVLLAGVRGADGFLRTNRRLEWSLASDGVGQFVDVGKSGLTDMLLGDFNRPRKIDNTFAIGSTSRTRLRLNRGTPTTSDDVCVLRGQGWTTVTSANEGTSQVTVYAPDVHAWDSRTQTARIHWVDAQWRFPPPAINPVGTRHVFTTSVMRHSDQAPCVGWLVRYEVVDGPAAGFAPDAAQSIEVASDATGQASAEIFQQQPAPGTNKISVQVIRPADLGGPHGKRLVVGRGTTLKTWTSPELAVRKTGPATAGLQTTVLYTIDVSNPGDLPAEDVLVTDELPEALAYVESNPVAESVGRKLQWRLGRLGADERRTLQVSCRATQLGSVSNCVEATAAGGLRAADCATTTVLAPSVDVRITGPQQATVGQQVTFSVQITNRSEVATSELLIKDHFDDGLEHAEAPSPIERDLGSLAAGATQRIEVTFRVTRPGRLCHTVEVTGPDGVGATSEACLTATEPTAAPQSPEVPPPTERPSVTVAVNGPKTGTVGGPVLFDIDVTNSGQQTLTAVTVTNRYDAGLVVENATDGWRWENNDLAWTIDVLPPGKTERLQVEFRCDVAKARACHQAAVSDAEGRRLADGEACLEVREAPGSLTVSVSDLADPVATGKELTYEILLANRGATSQNNVAVVVNVPDGMVPAAIGTSGPTRWAIDGQTVRFEPVIEILPGEQLAQSYRIRVRAQQPGEHVLRVEVTADTLPQTLTDEEDTMVVARAEDSR